MSKVKEVNGLEEFIGEISFDGNKFPVKMEANGIRSYIVKLKNPRKTYNIRQEPLKLDYNCKIIGPNGDNQVLYPSEITPSTVTANVSFNLKTSEDYNSLRCEGQHISISKDYNTLSILVASMEDCKTTFRWLDTNGKKIKDDSYHISSMTGYIGQWDTRIWKRKPNHHLKNQRDYAWINKCIGVQPGFINRDRLEWYSTHTHKNGKDQAYQYGYMYTITLNIPNGAQTLILPEDSRIQIFAMTTSQQFIKISNSQHLHDKFDY